MLSLYVTFFNILKKISFQKNVVSSNQGHNLGLNIQYSIIFIKYKIAENPHWLTSYLELYSPTA